MLGKLCAVCLGKYARRAFLLRFRLSYSRERSNIYLYYRGPDVRKRYFFVALSGIMAHNYKRHTWPRIHASARAVGKP
jgi:hypothetical protein